MQLIVRFVASNLLETNMVLLVTHCHKKIKNSERCRDGDGQTKYPQELNMVATGVPGMYHKQDRVYPCLKSPSLHKYIAAIPKLQSIAAMVLM